MAGIQTSKITTAGAANLVIQPGGQTKVKSILANNPGVTPLAADNNNQSLKKLVITDLPSKNEAADGDFIVIHDTATGTTKKVQVSSI